MSSLGKLRPICCHSLNEFICLCIGHGRISPSSPSASLFPNTTTPTPLSPPLTGVPLWWWGGGGFYIYRGALQAPIVPPSELTDRCPAPQCGGEPRESGGGRQLAITDSSQITGSWRRCRPDSSSASLHPLATRSACLLCICLLSSLRSGGSDVLTPCCCCSHRCCLRDSAACWEPRQDERSTGCPRVHSKVVFLYVLLLFNDCLHQE